MSVYSFCPEQILNVLADVQVKNKGSRKDIEEIYPLWINWIEKFGGCENKKQWAISNGIHDAIIQQVAYQSKNYKKFYIFENDYKFYWHILQPYNFETIKWQDINAIEPNSYIIVSQPNHIGRIHEDFDKLINLCKSKKSKIFLDCAFFGSSFETLNTDNDVF